ncbi:hypothetical protein Tco_0880169 [Tanacetum coccineum]
MFDLPLIDEPKPHPAYDFFAPGPLPGYAGNPNNNNGWIKADVPLLGELGTEPNEPVAILAMLSLVSRTRILRGSTRFLRDFKDDARRGWEGAGYWHPRSVQAVVARLAGRCSTETNVQIQHTADYMFIEMSIREITF